MQDDPRMDETRMAEFFGFLDALRESGATNMFGAGPYLAEAFDLDPAEAKRVVTVWMVTFDTESSAEDRAARGGRVDPDALDEDEPEDEDDPEFLAAMEAGRRGDTAPVLRYLIRQERERVAYLRGSIEVESWALADLEAAAPDWDDPDIRTVAEEFGGADAMRSGLGLLRDGRVSAASMIERAEAMIERLEAELAEIGRGADDA